MQRFVQELIEHTKEYESPTSFWKWASYAAIAGVLRDNVWLADGDSRLYPNVYILFLAGSAQRKGRPVTTAEQLVHVINNVKIISGRASIQAVLVEIGQTETDAAGAIKRGGSAIFFAPELAAGLVQDDQSIQILTDIYDHKPTGHTTNLIGRTKSKLEGVVFSMLAASNEELLKDFYSSKAINGGLLGRTFLVVPDEFRASNPFPKANPEGFKKLVALLRDISHLNGMMEFSTSAQQNYGDWYKDFRDKARVRNDRAGVLGRLHTNVKKLAVILAANDLSRTVELHHVEQAIHECLILIPNYSSFVMASGKSTIAEAGAIVLEELVKNGKASKKELIRSYWMYFDPDTLDKTMTAFELAEIVTTIVSGSDIFYKLAKKGLEIMGRGDQK